MNHVAKPDTCELGMRGQPEPPPKVVWWRRWWRNRFRGRFGRVFRAWDTLIYDDDWD